MTQYVYFFGGGKADGNKDMKDTLGGKGAGLAEMTNAGVPVPPGFTISTQACNAYYDERRQARRPRWTSRWTPPSRSSRPSWARSSATRPTRCSSRSAAARSSRCPA